MGLKDKVQDQELKKGSKELLTPKEISFITTKLRQATYQGTEFETFYQVMAKLQSLSENKN